MQHRGAVGQVHEELVHLVRQLVTGDRVDSGTPTFAQHSVLAYIGRNPECRASQIAEAFSVHRSTISRQIRSCVDSGWVHAEAGPVRSGHPLTLTSSGQGVLAQADRDRRSEVAERMAGWPAVDIENFARMLHRFVSSDPTDTDGGNSNA